jgi:formamidopyrimidine-DNA glycosylase
MPELPEVEIAARNLRRWTRGRSILRVEVDARAGRVFRPEGGARLSRLLTGARFGAVHRRGKNLLVELRKGRGAVGLWSHLGMTGKWLLRRHGEELPRHARLALHLGGGRVLLYVDPRLFGRLRAVRGGVARFPEVHALGPDPLHDGIDPEALRSRLSRTRRAVKVALLDQAILPGVGNIYASEALFAARIDPRRPARELGAAEVRRIAAAVISSMRRAIRLQEGPEIRYVEEPGAANPFRVYQREGERCPRCRRVEVRRIVQAQRSTFFCPGCQA